MDFSQMTDITVDNLKKAVETYGGVRPASRKLGIPESTIRGRLKSTKKPSTTRSDGDSAKPVLVISDCHAPAMRPEAVEFLRETYKKYKCGRVVHIGDLVDFHNLSYHEKAVGGLGANDEYNEARKQVADLHKAFPEVDWLIGNHDDLNKRKATTFGIPHYLLKDLTDLFGLKRWVAHPRYSTIELNGVLYRHGDKGKAGAFPALPNAVSEFQSLVQGHHHTKAGIQVFANQFKLIFGLQVGCLTDDSHEIMQYGKQYTGKSIAGCGVVIDDTHAIFEPMKL